MVTAVTPLGEAALASCLSLDGAEIGVGPQVLIGGGEKCIRLEGSPIGDGALLLRVYDGKRNRRGRGQVGIDKIGQAASEGSEPGNAEYIVVGHLGFDGEVGLMDLGDLEVRIEVVHSRVAAR